MRSRGRRVAPTRRGEGRVVSALTRFVRPAGWTRDGLIAAAACLAVVAVVLTVVWRTQLSDNAPLAAASETIAGGGSGMAPLVSTDGPSSASPTPHRAAVRRSTHARPASARRQSLARIAERQARQAAEPVTSTLRLASLNILGSNHVGRGLARAAGESNMLENLGVDVVGLQEVQRDQRQVFLNQMSGYTMWPQDAVGRQGYRLQILFRTDRFDMVDGGSVNSPFVGMSVPMPYVLLRDRANGVEFWVVDAHLSPQGRQAERNAGTVIQRALVDRLNDSHPVVMVGDMNEHTSWFCRLAGGVPVISANGGSSTSGCAPSGPVRIDWIVGSGSSDGSVTFSDYVQDIATKRLGLSDHYLVYSTAAVTAPPTDLTTP